MSSKVQLCNMALSRLGANTITSLTDGTSEAKLCNTFFNDISEEVISEGSWSSTIRRASLAKTTNTPVYDYTSEFQLPVDPKALKILNVNESSPNDIDYVIEDDKLLTDESTIKIRYVAFITDTEDWDVYLKRAFVARLCSELAYALTGDEGKSQSEFERYRLFLNEGLALNNQQGSKQVYVSNDLIDIR